MHRRGDNDAFSKETETKRLQRKLQLRIDSVIAILVPHVPCVLAVAFIGAHSWE